VGFALAAEPPSAHGGNVDDPTFAELSQFFTPQQIVEISYTVGTY
jgi:hypothetical protein